MPAATKQVVFALAAGRRRHSKGVAGGVLIELRLENVLVEEAMQLFVGHVDAQLLKGVVIKVFKAENVQHGHFDDTVVHQGWLQEVVGPRDEPFKEPLVHHFGHAVTDLGQG